MKIEPKHFGVIIAKVQTQPDVCTYNIYYQSSSALFNRYITLYNYPDNLYNIGDTIILTKK
jgi:hypothetical protein